jgi:pSer/pThr/pTyr-binding forkhead associated (FHA) protein
MADFKVPDIIPFHKRKNVADSESSSSGSEINNKVQSAPKQEDSSQTDDENEVLSKVPYNEPSWSGLPSQLSSHVLSVIKRGVEIDSICLDKRYHIFGRLPVCDIHLEHPSISRYHAVLQYRPVSSDSANESVLFSTNPRDAGYYIYDLGSTHGTFLNKNKVQPFYYYRVRVGQTMKFGGSSRIFVLEQLDHAAQNIVELEAKAEIKVLQENSQLFAKAEADRIMKQNYEESLGATWGLC